MRFLSKSRRLILDITGGAPELNSNFNYFINEARPLAGEIIVRPNFTVFYFRDFNWLLNDYSHI